MEKVIKMLMLVSLPAPSPVNGCDCYSQGDTAQG